MAPNKININLVLFLDPLWLQVLKVFPVCGANDPMCKTETVL